MGRRALLLCALLAAVAGRAPGQIVLHEETDWIGPPFALGDYDEQILPPVPFPYAGPSNPLGTCGLNPPFPTCPSAPLGGTLWHRETDCCAAGAGAPAGWDGAFAAYNSGPPLFAYGAGLANAGAITSYGIGAVAARPSPASTRIVLSFQYVKLTEPSSPAFDTASVEVREAPCGEPPGLDPPGLASWTAISVLPSTPVPCSGPVHCTIGPGHPVLDGAFLTAGPPAGAGGKIRFRFDTHDGALNGACGWSVDAVLLTNEECDVPCPGPDSFEPRIGSTGGEPVSPNPAFAITLSGAPPDGLALPFLGFADAAPVPIPFPSACALCCTPALFLAAVVVSPSGEATHPLPLPPGLSPCGEPLCIQWVVLTIPPFGPFNVYTSSSGKIRIQLG